MIRHVMADGARRDSIEGYILPKEISKDILLMMKERRDSVDHNKTGAIREKQILDREA